MEVIGALKKSGTSYTVFFCKYGEPDFNWNDIIDLLVGCDTPMTLYEEDIYCVAVYSEDVSPDERRLIGITFRTSDGYIHLTLPEYEYVGAYLEELTEMEW